MSVEPDTPDARPDPSDGLPTPSADRLTLLLLAAILAVGALGFWVIGLSGQVDAAAETSNS